MSPMQSLKTAKQPQSYSRTMVDRYAQERGVLVSKKYVDPGERGSQVPMATR